MHDNQSHLIIEYRDFCNVFDSKSYIIFLNNLFLFLCLLKQHNPHNIFTLNDSLADYKGDFFKFFFSILDFVINCCFASIMTSPILCVFGLRHLITGTLTPAKR